MKKLLLFLLALTVPCLAAQLPRPVMVDTNNVLTTPTAAQLAAANPLLAGGSDAVARASATLALAQNVRTSNAIPTTAAQVGADAAGAAATASSGVYAALSPSIATAQSTGVTAYAQAALAYQLALTNTTGVKGIVLPDGSTNSGMVSLYAANVGAVSNINGHLTNGTMQGAQMQAATRIWGSDYSATNIAVTGTVTYSAQKMPGTNPVTGAPNLDFMVTGQGDEKWPVISLLTNAMSQYEGVPGPDIFFPPTNSFQTIFNGIGTNQVCQGPSAVVAADGNYLVAFRLASHNDINWGAVCLLKVSPAGSVLSTNILFQDQTGVDSADCSLFKTQAGTILLLFHLYNSNVDTTPTNCMRILRSTDSGLTWTTNQLFNTGTYTLTAGRICQCASGKILFPYYQKNSATNTYCNSWVQSSTDDGVTIGNPVQIADLTSAACSADEPSLVCVGSSNVLAFIRADGANIWTYTTRSADAGATWSAPTSNGVPRFVCKVDGLMLQNGLLLADSRIYNFNSVGYSISADTGTTWSAIREIDGRYISAGGVMAYSSAVEFKPGMVGLVYSYRVDGGATNAPLVLRYGAFAGRSPLGDVFGLSNAPTHVVWSDASTMASNLVGAGSAAFAGSNQFVRAGVLNGSTSTVDSTSGVLNLGTIAAGQAPTWCCSATAPNTDMKIVVTLASNAASTYATWPIPADATNIVKISISIYGVNSNSFGPGGVGITNLCIGAAVPNMGGGISASQALVPLSTNDVVTWGGSMTIRASRTVTNSLPISANQGFGAVMVYYFNTGWGGPISNINGQASLQFAK